MTTATPEPKAVREETAIVLDYLEHGYTLDQATVKTPIVHMGVEFLSILELIPKKGIALQPHKVVYIGEGKREEIHHIKGKFQ